MFEVRPAVERGVAIPTRRSQLLFEAKAAALRIPRLARDLIERPRLGREAERSTSMRPFATSISPLWAGGEATLTAGKVQNLRLAARAIDGRAFEAGEVFSFWRHVGRPSARRGFALGRELREGCLVPNVGGGLCQLSNALYDAALEAGFEIVERHAHTAKVPGSLAELGRDATVFWNYVDLRFRAPGPFVIEARLTARELIVRLLGHGASPERPAAPRHRLDALSARAPSSCASCGEARCPSNAPGLARARFGRTAFLVDRAEPELARWVSASHADRDVMMLPVDPRLVPRARYAWPTDFASVRQALGPTIVRSIASRRLASQGAARQRALLAHDARLAAWMAARLSAEDTHLVVAQTLLPFLWQRGALGGRTFDVLAARLPMSALHARLDRARREIPESPTLADFRAPASLVQAEDEALEAAARVITAHAEIAALFGARAERVPWAMPRARRARPGDRIVFLGPVVARRGVHLLREVMRETDRPLVVPGRDLEGGFDWGRPVERAAADPLEGAAAVVLPAWVEHSPRELLRAAARGVPVLASAACGLEGVAGVRTVPTGDERALGQAIRELSREGVQARAER